MNYIVEKALALWGATGADYTLVAARENAVYRITKGDWTFALRLHRQGYRTDQELWSELQWMEAAAKGGIIVPRPIPTPSGDVLRVVDDVQVDALTWLAGAPVAEIFETLGLPQRAHIFRNLGREMACLHKVCDSWTLPNGFTRCAWDVEGLVGGNPLWDRFWDNPELSREDRELFLQVRDIGQKHLGALKGNLDFGLIHADLVSTNVMIDGDQLKFIDFDDGGFGFRLFEVATALLKFIEDPNYAELKSALFAGYRSVRPLDTSAFDLFLLLRATTYVGWNITRMAEAGADRRNVRFENTARKLALAYLQA